jgi:hypothetical protein
MPQKKTLLLLMAIEGVITCMTVVSSSEILSKIAQYASY